MDIHASVPLPRYLINLGTAPVHPHRNRITIQPCFFRYNVNASNVDEGLRGQILGVRGQISGLKDQVPGLRGQGGMDKRTNG